MVFESLKFCKQSDFRESCKNSFFFFRKTRPCDPRIIVKKLKMTHAQPTQKRNIFRRYVNWLNFALCFHIFNQKCDSQKRAFCECFNFDSEPCRIKNKCSRILRSFKTCRDPQ